MNQSRSKYKIGSYMAGKVSYMSQHVEVNTDQYLIQYLIKKKFIDTTRDWFSNIELPMINGGSRGISLKKL